jgi:prevent-host-death family protein
MRTASLTEAKAKLSDFLDEARTSGPVVITRNGRAVAVLLAPVDDDDLERLLLSRSPRFRALLSRSRASVRAGEGVAHAAFWKAAGERVERPTSTRGKSRAAGADRSPPGPSLMRAKAETRRTSGTRGRRGRGG